MFEKERKNKFRNIVRAHFKAHGRTTLPWRKTKDPYRIVVSELMLQQTQASRVVSKYNEFLKLFPTAQTLAAAPFPSVLTAWSGLGYNRRAKYLHQLAKVIVQKYKGKFPKTFETLRILPGIGPYTAAAVVVFAYNKPVPLVETNIRTAYLHHFFPKHLANGRKVTDGELLSVIKDTFDVARPREWVNALMDYGAHLKQQGNKIHRVSSKYKKQSTFAGSKRQLRGAVVKLLLEKQQTEVMITKAFERSREETREVLDALMREGLIAKKGSTYFLAVN